MGFTTQELIECAQRELAMRRTCYVKWAGGKPLTPGKQKEIDMMEAIVGLLGNMESAQQTNQVLSKRLLDIQAEVADHDCPAETKLQLISAILNPIH